MAATFPDTHLDLLQDGQFAVLSTVGPDGYPQSTVVWFLLEDGVLRTSVTKGRQKYKNLAREPKATLVVVDPANPYRTIEIRADVTIEDDADLAFLRRELAKYDTTVDGFGAPLDDRVVLTFEPTRVNVFG